MKAAPHRARDPYLNWAIATQFAGHSALAKRPGNGFLPLLIKAPLKSTELPETWRVPRHYASRAATRFWTAWVPAADRDALADLDLDCAMSLPLREVSPTAPLREPVPPEAAEDDTPLIGVIDNGCAFLNQVFSRPGHPETTRFISLWRQRPASASDPAWQVPADFGYGLELLGRDIHPGPEVDEPSDYARLGYPVDREGRLSDMLHGTHVLDIAAGLPQDLPAQAAAKPAKADEACSADLVFVELPQPLDEDTTGAAMDAFILDAVHYVLRCARPTQRVVINLSLGAQAGPHDGGSLIEQALDQLIEVEGKERLSICVAAGNGAEEHWHASGALTRDNREISAGWRTVPGDTTDSFLELWASATDPTGLKGLQVVLTAPDGRRLTAKLDSRTELRRDAALQASLELRRMPRFKGRHRASALVSLAPTAGGRAGLPAGLWQVSASCSPPAGAPDCRIALWLQRDTPGRSLSEVLQSEFEALSPNLQWAGAAALSHLAGARRVLTVGAARLSDSQPSSYSPRDGIDAWAMADESSRVYGLLCSGGLSGSVFRISGTSAATPMVVRALANDRLKSPAPPPPLPLKGNSYRPANQPAKATPARAPRAGVPLVRPDGGEPGVMHLDQA